MAQDDTCHSCLGRDSSKGHVFARPILRIKARRGSKKALIAVAASILQAGHFERRDKTKAIGRRLRKLDDLGCQVEVKALPA